MRRRPLPYLLLPGLLVATAFSQNAEPTKSFEERLVEILRERGLLDAATEKELLDLAAQMRAQDKESSAALDREVRALAAAFEKGGAQDQAKPPVQVAYDHGFKLTTPDGDFSLRIRAVVQLRATYSDLDDSDAGSDDTLSLSVNRLRLGFEGNAYGKD